MFTLTEFWRMETGKALEGIELKYSRKSGCSLSGLSESFRMILSMDSIQEASK
jgi:hypothetical protein